jgi:hypothetical protein
MLRISQLNRLLLKTFSLVVLFHAACLERGAAATSLTIEGTHFVVNGKPCFLLGISYYGGLGAAEDSIRKDLDDAQRYGFNWLRLWATWAGSGSDVSAVGTDGGSREPFLGKLRWLVAECDRRGLIVDITLNRGKESQSSPAGGWLADLASHQRAVETLVTALKPQRNWYLDLANEHDVGMTWTNRNCARASAALVWTSSPLTGHARPNRPAKRRHKPARHSPLWTGLATRRQCITRSLSGVVTAAGNLRRRITWLTCAVQSLAVLPVGASTTAHKTGPPPANPGVRSICTTNACSISSMARN